MQVNRLKQIFGDTYRQVFNARRKRKHRLAALRSSKRSRVRKKWLKYQEPAEPDRGSFGYFESAPHYDVNTHRWGWR